ncbi:copine-5 isoform X2 [Cryptotermes secundus]|uniref:copine-5 isoform X2 n=1 Tax=Cryptotermes secundus TaxID=105785 RepID=UPI001454D0D2|nr:copine-5 isoform X2 [Cryptotermes secundus]
MIIIAEELVALKDEVIMQFNGTKLDKKKFIFWKSDPFLVFHKSLESGDYAVVHKTEVVKNTLNPTWQKFSIPVRTLCNGDYDRSIKVVCYDWNSSGDHSHIGEFFVTLRQLAEGPLGSNVFQCVHPEKQKKNSSYTHSGLISLDFFEIRQIHSFMDYIKGGTQLHCSIAIDFTGVLEAYRNCIHQVQLYGPTNFSPVINHVSRFASTYRDGSSYFILLILTDGIITDMPQTIQAIVSASVLPMSIIIVGIGTADFTAMEVLDADTVPLKAGGVHASRDIVQFVPFNRFVTMGDPSMARIRLAREVLAEIPTQFTGYMKANNIAPRPPQENVSVLPPDPMFAHTTI